MGNQGQQIFKYSTSLVTFIIIYCTWIYILHCIRNTVKKYKMQTRLSFYILTLSVTVSHCFNDRIWQKWVHTIQFQQKYRAFNVIKHAFLVGPHYHLELSTCPAIPHEDALGLQDPPLPTWRPSWKQQTRDQGQRQKPKTPAKKNSTPPLMTGTG